MESFNITDNVKVLPLCESKNYICVLLYTFLSFLTFVTVAGNLLVIISIAYFKQLHTPTNYLILSLAVADLLIGVIIFPFDMAVSLAHCFQRIDLLCNLRSNLDIVISISSVLNLCCISVDRYYAVCHPLMYKTKITDSVAVKMSLGSWAVAILTGIIGFTFGLYQEICEWECFLFLILTTIFTYYLPTIILLCIYSKILIVAQRQARSIQKETCKNKKSGTVASKKERKATKTLAIVMGLFLICWGPLFISYPFQLLSRVVVHLIEPFNWFALSNSMFNPFIYAFFYSWFRSAFRMIICGKIFQGDIANTKLH